MLLVGLLLPSAASADDGQIRYEQGLEAYQASQFPEALVSLRMALRSFRQRGDQGAEADCLVALGRVHRKLGRHADAIAHFEEALKLDRKLGRGSAAAGDETELGLEALALGRLKEAQKRFRTAFQLFQKHEDPLGAAAAAINLGIAQREASALDDARKSLEAALQLYTSAGDPGGEGDALTNLGGVLSDLGNYEAATRSQRAAIEAFDRAGDEAGRGAALHNLGNLYARLGDYEQAATLYRQSRPLLASEADRAAGDQALGTLLLAANQPAEAVRTFEAALAAAAERDRPGLLLNLGEAFELAGQAARATAAFVDALAAAEAVGDQPIQVAVLLALGDRQLDHDAANEAFATFKKAGALASRLEVEDLEWRSWYRIGLASKARGKSALTPLREAVGILEESRRSLEGLSPWTARRFVAERREVYESLIDALLREGDSAAALLYAERLQVGELSSTGSSAGGDSRYSALAQREGSLQDEIARAQKAPEARRDSERIAALREELGRTRVEFSRYVDELRTTHADFDRLVKVDPSDIEAYQKDLSDDEVLIQPVVLPDRIALLVFTSGPLVVRETEVPREDVEQRIGRVLRTMRKRNLDRPERLTEHLDMLGSWLWEPVAGELEGKRRVIVAASGALRYLPFQMIRREGRYLVQDHEVVNVTNVGSLKRRSDEELRVSGASLLALGNPDGSLPAADTEVERLGELFPGAAILQRDQATRERLVALAPGRSVLHLATHGILDAEAPERSYIVLAPEGEDSEGRLPYLEIPALYTALADTRLVVLSACETAVPLAPEGAAVQGGGLEIAGLANQFRRAGVPRLMASLWQVSDHSTGLLMSRFYSALGEGRAAPEALATAQRALLASPDQAHPFFWAPFILIGSPR